MMSQERGEFAGFWNQLEGIIKARPSTATVFNQYRDWNPEVDLPAAPSIRTSNLRRYMEKAMETATVLVVGEAAGPWGTRFSGVPFTGEKQLVDPAFPFAGEQSSRSDPQRATTIMPPYISNTAKMFWAVMRPYCADFVAWNAIPLHPHKPGDYLTVRNPGTREVSECLEARDSLRLVRAYMRPSCIVAVGKKAEGQLNALGVVPECVRHPSMGGEAEFVAGMKAVFTRLCR